MNTKDIEDLYKLFQQMTMSRDQQRDHHGYTSQQYEIEYFTKFASWIKQTYPDVWESWRALQDLEKSTQTEIGTPIWQNR